MFIYKITVLPINKSYIGFDTRPSYKLNRWKTHCKNYKNYNTKLYKAMNDYGLENCKIEILEDNFDKIAELALAEIRYIEQLDTFKNGLNSTKGGDGLGSRLLSTMTEDEILQIKQALGFRFSEYNKNVKWANTTAEQRREIIKPAFTPEINARRRETLKKYYEVHPESKEYKLSILKEWRKNNKEYHKKICAKNGLKGAEKVSKKLKIEKEDGTILFFQSKSEFNRQTGEWAKTIIQKTKEGKFHHGYKIIEV